MKIQEWIDLIVETHHKYLKKELPILSQAIIELSQRDKNPAWAELERIFKDLRHELDLHLMKEEVMLFPSMVHIENAVLSGAPLNLSRHDLRSSLEQAEYEHSATDEYLSQLLNCMKNIEKTPENTVLFSKLQILEADLREHMKKEEKGLFAEARFIYSKAIEGFLREE